MFIAKGMYTCQRGDRKSTPPWIMVMLQSFFLQQVRILGAHAHVPGAFLKPTERGGSKWLQTAGSYVGPCSSCLK